MAKTYLNLQSPSGRQMLIAVDAIEFAIENTIAGHHDRRSPTGWVSDRAVVHIVLASGEQGDAAVTWDEFMEALRGAQDDTDRRGGPLG